MLNFVYGYFIGKTVLGYFKDINCNKNTGVEVKIFSVMDFFVG